MAYIEGGLSQFLRYNQNLRDMNHIFSSTFNLPVVFTVVLYGPQGQWLSCWHLFLHRLIAETCRPRDSLTGSATCLADSACCHHIRDHAIIAAFSVNLLLRSAAQLILLWYNCDPLYAFGYSMYLRCPENIRQVSITLPFPSHP